MPGTGEGRPPGEAARGSVPARGCCGERGTRRRGAGARGAACARGSLGKASCGWWKKRGEVLGVCLSAAQLSRLYSALVRLHRSVSVVAASRGHHSPRVQRCPVGTRIGGREMIPAAKELTRAEGNGWLHTNVMGATKSSSV